MKGQAGSAGAAKRASPAGTPKKKTSCRVGKTREASSAGKTLPSQGPQAKTNVPAAMVSPLLVLTLTTRPAPPGASTFAARYATPLAEPSATTAATAR